MSDISKSEAFFFSHLGIICICLLLISITGCIALIAVHLVPSEVTHKCVCEYYFEAYDEGYNDAVNAVNYSNPYGCNSSFYELNKWYGYDDGYAEGSIAMGLKS